MIDLGSIFIGAAVSGSVGYITYSYRNTIAYTLTCVSAEFQIENGKVTHASSSASLQSLTVERLELKSFGFRRLQDVELHIPISRPLVFLEVSSTSSISKKAIRLDAGDKIIKVVIPILPKGEEIRLSFATTSSYENEYRQIRGTGGSYRVVEGKRHKLRREFAINCFWWALISVAAWGLPWLITWLDLAPKTPRPSQSSMQRPRR